ncbi:S23 rRNA-intervening sequence protein [Formosa agariphila KMM 3901]|uniref:S23 rRNA-intervening sequence protein n=1 Tax=Formosa agariphila (strain DSM 15362 / KCTC 12365 / LMG 23005 / KMM 3901 / M-2Alg 35-1) TaxID=1347342 RepID=T2KNL8_FORAG|nr:four helix bundle protein [Formosa agariphila]CDF80041.1 S23 rRNA-intervening sequence protein [Formosa agariphila KMM 3901]
MDYKELDVWKRSMDLVTVIYKWTSDLPESEKYGLCSQIRRAAVSVPSNIAEGSARRGDKELLNFLNYALGSVAEVETQYLIILRLQLLEEHKDLYTLIINVKKLILGYRNYIIKK